MFELSKLKFVQEIYAFCSAFFGVQTEAEIHQATEKHKELTMESLKENLKQEALQAVKDEMQTLQGKMDSFTKTVDEMKTEAGTKDKQIETLQGEIKTLQDSEGAKVKELATAKEEAAKEIAGLKTEISKVKAGKQDELDEETQSIQTVGGIQGTKVNVVKNAALSSFMTPEPVGAGSK